MKRLLGNFVFDIFMAIIFVALGVLMLPIFPIGRVVISILAALLVVAYMVIFLTKKIEKARSVYFIALLIEFVLMALLALGLILKQFNLFGFAAICQFAGAALWIGSTVSLLGERFSTAKVTKRRALITFFIDVLLLSFGTVLMFKPFIGDEALLWIFSVSAFILTLGFVFLSIVFAPRKNKEK